MARFLITGGAGFIGSHFAELALAEGHEVLVLDKLTYAGLRENVPRGAGFALTDICSEDSVRAQLTLFRPDAVFNFAAESHVCRSISEAYSFIDSNVRGTYSLLKATYDHWLSRGKSRRFRYVQISTDEVFGDLDLSDPPFTEKSPLRPNSPYAASKCAADHFVRSFGHTYGLPVLLTHCSNNYGPRQHPEKLIPAAVSCFLKGGTFGLHGSGQNIRDWIWVTDHCLGVLAAWAKGAPGRSYCFGGSAERTNLTIVRQILRLVGGTGSYQTVADRPGNDRRYAIDFSLASLELDWKPKMNFEDGLKLTVEWYRSHSEWLRLIEESRYGT